MSILIKKEIKVELITMCIVNLREYSTQLNATIVGDEYQTVCVCVSIQRAMTNDVEEKGAVGVYFFGTTPMYIRYSSLLKRNGKSIHSYVYGDIT